MIFLLTTIIVNVQFKKLTKSELAPNGKQFTLNNNFIKI